VLNDKPIGLLCGEKGMRLNGQLKTTADLGEINKIP
jgi:hypothetical protein